MGAMAEGPCYGVELLDKLPLGGGGMKQALPTRSDLERVREISERTAAGYEVLLDHYYDRRDEVDSLKAQVAHLADGFDELAEVWGDEGVFKRLRQRLRELAGTDDSAGNGEIH